MGLSAVQKIILANSVDGAPPPEPGAVVPLRIAQVLAHDQSGLAVLHHFGRLGAVRVRCDACVFYADHDIAPSSPDGWERLEHIQVAATRCGAHYSRPGNGIAHEVHAERFAVPGRTVLGADPHVHALGALGMLALFGDAVELAAAMAGEPYHLVVPEIVRVVLKGKPRPFVSPKDIPLELLRRRGVGGMRGKALEVDGPGLRALDVHGRAAIAAMGAQLGAFAVLFPSDEKTQTFLQRQRRSKAWRRVEADSDARYAETEEVDLGALEPLALCPPAPGHVRTVREVQGPRVREVLIGSGGSGSVRDLLAVAAMIRGKKVHADCTLGVSPGSRQVLEVLAREASRDGGSPLADLVAAGARILESGGALPSTCTLPAGAASVRTSSTLIGTAGATVYVVSPETAVATAIHGRLTDPRKLRRPARVKVPRQLPVDDSMIVRPLRDNRPSAQPARLQARAEIPLPEPIKGSLRARVVKRLGHCAGLDEVSRPVDGGGPSVGNGRRGASCLIAGRDLGHGQLDAEVPLAERLDGIRLVIAAGFEPACELRLAKAGVVPLQFANPKDYERIDEGDQLVLPALAQSLKRGGAVRVSIGTQREQFDAYCNLAGPCFDVLMAGGLIGYLARSRGAEARA